MSLILDKTWQPALTRRMLETLEPGSLFVDVGANIGLFTILAAARVGRGGRVFAYECNPELLSFLERNVEMNWFSDRVRVVPKAAHRDREPREFIAPRELKMLGSLTRHQTYARNGPYTKCEASTNNTARLPRSAWFSRGRSSSRRKSACSPGSALAGTVPTFRHPRPSVF